MPFTTLISQTLCQIIPDGLSKGQISVEKGEALLSPALSALTFPLRKSSRWKTDRTQSRQGIPTGRIAALADLKSPRLGPVRGIGT